MKRLALAFAALTVVSVAQAQEDVEFKPTGEFRVRYENFSNPTAVKGAADDHSEVTARGKLGLTMRKGETLSSNVTVIHNSFLGAETGTGTNTDASGAGNFDQNDTQNQLLVNRFWGWWKATDTLSFKVGRMGIEVADGAVLAENDYEDVPTSHEGLLAMWDLDFAGVGLFALKANELGTGNLTGDAEANIYGVNFDFKNLPEVLKMANLHAMQINQDELTAATVPAGGAVNSQRFGATVGGEVAGFNYKVTAAYVTGKQKTRGPNGGSATDLSNDINGSMYDVLLGYALPDVMGLKFWATYHMDSGDKDNTDTKQGTYNSFFYDRHAYAGLMDVVEWGNLTYWGLGASLTPMENLEAGLGYYMFSHTEKGANAAGATFGPEYRNNTLDAQTDALSSDPTKGDIGSELDIYANQSYEGGFKIGARVGMFMPGAAMKDLAPKRDQTIMQYFLQASMAF